MTATKVSVKGQTRSAIEFSVGDTQRASTNIARRGNKKKKKTWTPRAAPIDIQFVADKIISILPSGRENASAITRKLNDLGYNFRYLQLVARAN